MYYLAYGSNLNLKEMKHRCPFYKVVGTMYLYNFKLSFKGEVNRFLTIESKEGSIVPIGIFKINKLFIKNLDKYEGYPYLYDKKEIEFELNGKKVKGLIYIMKDEFDYALPDSNYFKRCEVGYNDFNFDKSYLNEALNYTANSITNKKMTRNLHLWQFFDKKWLHLLKK